MRCGLIGRLSNTPHAMSCSLHAPPPHKTAARPKVRQKNHPPTCPHIQPGHGTLTSLSGMIYTVGIQRLSGGGKHSAVHDLLLGFSQDRVGVQGWSLLPSMGTCVGRACPDCHTAKRAAAYSATFSYPFPPANWEFCVRQKLDN